MTSHVKRILTAVVLLPILAAVLFSSSGVVSLALVLVGSFGLWEFYSLFWPGKDNRSLKVLGVLCGALLVVAAYGGQFQSMLVVLILLFWAFQLSFLTRFGLRHPDASHTHSQTLLAGLLYVTLPLTLFLFLGPAESGLVLLAAFATDTGGYYAGSLWGRRKIWPVVSPKKTWMGSLGGLVLCMAVTTVYGLWLGHSPLWTWLLLGVALNLAAQTGDFFESALKRWLEVKDSGQILPGHGGILDRIDSLLLVLPIYAGLRLLHAFFD